MHTINRTINNAGYTDHTNPLFFKSNTLKFMYLVKFKTAQIMFKARNTLLLNHIQGVFTNGPRLKSKGRSMC